MSNIDLVSVARYYYSVPFRIKVHYGPYSNSDFLNGKVREALDLEISMVKPGDRIALLWAKNSHLPDDWRSSLNAAIAQVRESQSK
jgi:hypothetical protein